MPDAVMIHPIKLDPLPEEDGWGDRIGEVYRRTSGDDLLANPWGAEIADGEDDLWPVGIYPTETEAIAAVIRWQMELMQG